MPNRPQVVVPREGPHALISTDVHTHAAQPSTGHQASLRCHGSVAWQHVGRGELSLKGLAWGSMGMNV